MLGGCAEKLFAFYAKALCITATLLGLSVCSSHRGKWQPVGSIQNDWAKVSSSISLVVAAAIICGQIQSISCGVSVLGIVLYLPTLVTLVAYSLLAVVLSQTRRLHSNKVQQFVLELLVLGCKALQLLSVAPALKARHILATYHCVWFALYALFSTTLLLHDVTLILIHMATFPHWTTVVNGLMMIFQLLHYYTFIIAYTMALLLFDGLCKRLQQVLIATRHSGQPQDFARQQRCKRCLLRLLAWHNSCNHLLAPALFLYYTIFFISMLTGFYAMLVKANDFMKMETNAFSFVLTYLILLLPHLTNLFAEQACRSYQRAVNAVAAISRTRRSRLHPDEYLLLSQAGAMSFRCGRFFRINRGLTIIFVTQIFSYMIILMQYHMQANE